MTENKSKKQKQRSFIYSHNSNLLICQLTQESLLLILLPCSSKEQDQNYYYKKEYSNQFFQKDSFSIFENYLDFYQTLQSAKQNNTLKLNLNSFSLQLQVFKKKIQKSFQLQKIKFSLTERCLLKGKQWITMRNNLPSFNNQYKSYRVQNKQLQINVKQKQAKDQQHENLKKQLVFKQQEVQKMQKQLNSRLQEIQTMKKEIKQLLLIAQKQKNQIQKLQKSSFSQNENENEEQDKKVKKQNKKMLKKRESIKQQQNKIKQYSQKQNVNKLTTNFIKEKFKNIENQIQLYNQQHRLNLTQQFIEYCIDFCNQINFSVTCLNQIKQHKLPNVQLLLLQNNNICDDGWRTFLTIDFSNLKILSVGNNNLTNLRFNKQLLKLQKLYLADNQKIYRFFNTLSKQTLTQLLRFQWKNLKFLSINFRKYSNQLKKQIQEDNNIWQQFLKSNFRQFPALKVLHIGNIDLQLEAKQKIQTLCQQKRIKLQRYRKEVN